MYLYGRSFYRYNRVVAFLPLATWGYIGFVEEIPGANSQGDTLDEVRENLREAVQLVLEANRELAEQALIGQKVEREPFDLASQ